MDTLKATDLTLGQVYYECQSGVNMELTVIAEVETGEGFEGRKTYSWKAARKDGTEVDCLITEGLEHYGPRLYSKPQYVTAKDGEFTFKTI